MKSDRREIGLDENNNADERFRKFVLPDKTSQNKTYFFQNWKRLYLKVLWPFLGSSAFYLVKRNILLSFISLSRNIMD